MAIEDEIINISDIDIGTEILNNDKLLVETNNGTKLVAFKDFVVGPDNISSIRQEQIEGNPVGEATASFQSITGFNVLGTNTTPGLNTKYSDLSGTVELTKFLFDAITHLATLSSSILSTESKQADVEANIANLDSTLKSTSSSILSSITLTTKSCNFIVTGASRLESAKPKVSFTGIDLDPADTNENCSLQLSPFLVTYPSANQNFSNNTVIRFTGHFQQNIRKNNVVREGTSNRADQVNENGSITLFKDKADGSSEAIITSQAVGPTTNDAGANPNNFSITVRVDQGDKIRITANSGVTGRFEGIRAT